MRRIFKKAGQKVLRLIRFGFGNVRLPENLAPGQMRPLGQEELIYLKGSIGLLG